MKTLERVFRNHNCDFIAPFPSSSERSLDKHPESARIGLVKMIHPVIPLRFNGDFYCLLSIYVNPTLDNPVCFFRFASPNWVQHDEMLAVADNPVRRHLADFSQITLAAVRFALVRL